MASTFIWYELLTSDPESAADFYEAVLGCTVTDSGQEGMDYRILAIDKVAVGGLMALPADAAESGLRPAWYGYVSVDDVDISVANILAAGGDECMPARDVPGIGRMAMIFDPQGAALYVMSPEGEEGQATSFAPGKPGHGGWHELHTSDWEAAFAFYKEQFDWDKARAMDMGALGTYQMFNFGSGDAVGGMMNESDIARPYWLYYFNVDDIAAARSRVVANGGTIIVEPHQVPTGDWIITAHDPRGALFALVGPKI